MHDSTSKAEKPNGDSPNKVNPYKEIIVANNPTDMAKVIQQFRQDLSNLQNNHKG